MEEEKEGNKYDVDVTKEIQFCLNTQKGRNWTEEKELKTIVLLFCVINIWKKTNKQTNGTRTHT